MNSNPSLFNKKPRLVVFASGSGTTLNYMVETSYFNVVLLITNKKICGAIEVAKKHRIPFKVIRLKDFLNFKEWNQNLCQELEEIDLDFIILAGYLNRLGDLFLSKYRNQVINSHPSLLPKYGGQGMYGTHVHKAVLESKDKKTGITIHFVNKEYDKGSTIAQKEVNVLREDTIQSLEERVKKVEKVFYTEVILDLWRKKLLKKEALC